MKLRSKDLKAFSQPSAIKEENPSVKRKSSDQGATSKKQSPQKVCKTTVGIKLLSLVSLLNLYCWMMNLLICLLVLNLCGVTSSIFMG